MISKDAKSQFQTTETEIGHTMQMAELPDGALWMAETTRSVHPMILPGHHDVEPDPRDAHHASRYGNGQAQDQMDPKQSCARSRPQPGYSC
jgi:hypothetical protein